MTRRLVVAAALAAVVAGKAREAHAQNYGFGLPWTSSALADRQVWLQNRQLLEGRGIRAGNFELHPGVGAEFGFDSNTFYSSGAAGAPVRSSLRLRVTPTFYVSTLGSQRSTNSDSASTALPTVNFRGGVGLVYHEFIGLQSDVSLSGLRNLGAQSSLRFDFFPGRTWQLGLGADFVRVIQPGAQDGVLVGPSNGRGLNRNTLSGSLEVAYAPGRGVFEFRFGYNVQASLWDELTGNNSLNNTGFMRMRWRFLPRTALVWEGSVSRLTYLNAPDAYSTGMFSAMPITTRFGIAGLLTNRVSIMALAGFTGTFYEYGDNADTVVGQAEAQWLINARSQLRGGFVRDVQQSYFGNYYIRNRGYVGYLQSFAGRFVLNVDAGVGLYQYGYVTVRSNASGASPGSPLSGVTNTNSDGSFNATRVDGVIFGEYRISDVFGINATARGEALISTVAIRDQAISWTRFDAYLGVRANW